MITTHYDGVKKIEMEVIYATGEVITTEYVNNFVISQTSTISDNVKIANNTHIPVPYGGVFSTSYVDIGSIIFNTDSVGVTYNVSIQCKEISHQYNTQYNLNEVLTQSTQYLVTCLISYLAPLSWLSSKRLIAQNLVNSLIENGIITVGTNEIIEALTANYVEGYITKYDVKFENQYGAGGGDIGTTLYFKVPGTNFYTLEYDSMYPQFLKNRDTDLARIIYFNYDGGAFPGVRSWNATKTVTYYYGQSS